MAARSSWKGFLKLSLVSLPVKAYTASASLKGVSLNQLHKECNSRVKYKKVCPEHGELQAEDIVRVPGFGQLNIVTTLPAYGSQSTKRRWLGLKWITMRMDNSCVRIGLKKQVDKDQIQRCLKYPRTWRFPML